MNRPAQARTEGAATFAAVDLGSNSFHLLVARRTHGELRVLDRIKEMVRLGGGLDEHGKLEDATRARAIDCLARFGQRLRGIPAENIRAVGTQTLRRMQNANSFLLVAETALGCPVEIIGGREEARLIYLGVSQGVSGVDDRRLVIDIGGGSTELIVGTGPAPAELESLQFGCVSLTHRFFPGGRIGQARWNEARNAVRAELQEHQRRYRDAGWDRAIGSSGTIRAVATICLARRLCERNITAQALGQVRDAVLGFDQAADIDLPGLSERRRAVLPGGLVILQACFEALAIDELEVSPFALREGVLHDLLGRLEHRDPRDTTVRAFMSRYGVDTRQAERVRQAAVGAYDQLAANLELRPGYRDMLAWAADLHETGLGISHSHYQQHSGYLVEQSDMAGFSRQEQLFLAALVRHHRRAIPAGHAGDLPARLHLPLRQLLFCLRFAWILCRSRDRGPGPAFSLTMRDRNIRASFPGDWIDGHPLTAADLEQERTELRALGLEFELKAG
jgi:exopolyphosphatase/guanosine-5'-triphosphate,3'-diphosphate pyrophosphatase